MELDTQFARAENAHYSRLEREAERRMWEVEELEHAIVEISENAVWAQIQNDCIDVMANTNASRYQTLNWLLARILTSPTDELSERRDDFLQILKTETHDYIARSK